MPSRAVRPLFTSSISRRFKLSTGQRLWSGRRMLWLAVSVRLARTFERVPHQYPRRGCLGNLNGVWSLVAFFGLSSSGGSSRSANGVRLSSCCFHSASFRCRRFSALAARASTRLGKPSALQYAARFNPPRRERAAFAVSELKGKMHGIRPHA